MRQQNNTVLGKLVEMHSRVVYTNATRVWWDIHKSPHCYFFQRLCQWKMLENQLTFGKDMDNPNGTFLRHSVVLVVVVVVAAAILLQYYYYYYHCHYYY